MIRFVIVYWRGIIGAAVSLLLCGMYATHPTVWIFVGTCVAWCLCLGGVWYRHIRERELWPSLALLASSYLSTLLLMSLTEWRVVMYMIVVLAAIVHGAFLTIAEQELDDRVQVYMRKAMRRMQVMGWVFVHAALSITTFAISVFFPGVAMWILFCCVGLYSSFIAYAIWRMYYEQGIRTFSLWMLVVAGVSIEICWALQLLPFGYSVLGACGVWLWYLLVLLIRFHMSVEGVHWEKQRSFFIQNAVLFVVMLYVIRWI